MRPAALATLALGLALARCGGDASSTDAATTDATDATTDATDAIDTADADATVDAPTTGDTATTGCGGLLAGPYGTHRGQRAGPLALALVDGRTFDLADARAACDVVVIATDETAVSALDARSIWDVDGAIGDLVARSPDHARYVFVPTGASAEAARAHAEALQAAIDAALAALDPADAEAWRDRLLVAADRAPDSGTWLAEPLAGWLQGGLVIDRGQRIRGIGALADVDRQRMDLAQAGAWQWENNLAYLAYEALAAAVDAELSDALAAHARASVTLFSGEVLSEQAAVDVTIPADLSAFDTLEVEGTLACPDPNAHELASCGAWDYLAELYVREGEGAGATELEVARFITSYHRESHFIVDATALLPRLAGGGVRHFRWSFAPSWNPQPTATTLRLVFGARGRGVRPVAVTPLFAGGDFGSAYNAGREPLEVPIPATAKRVELWALTTGHGSGTSQCAEFCAHQHAFTVAGHLHMQTFPAVGERDGCVDDLALGGTPNQAGTWWFGRGGWCPGAVVRPWVVDVTSDVAPGSPATVAYRGLLAGRDPPDGAGNIVLSSYLVIYE